MNAMKRGALANPGAKGRAMRPFKIAAQLGVVALFALSLDSLAYGSCNRSTREMLINSGLSRACRRTNTQ